MIHARIFTRGLRNLNTSHTKLMHYLCVIIIIINVHGVYCCLCAVCLYNVTYVLLYIMFDWRTYILYIYYTCGFWLWMYAHLNFFMYLVYVLWRWCIGNVFKIKIPQQGCWKSVLLHSNIHVLLKKKGCNRIYRTTDSTTN